MSPQDEDVELLVAEPFLSFSFCSLVPAPTLFWVFFFFFCLKSSCYTTAKFSMSGFRKQCLSGPKSDRDVRKQ